MACLADQAAPPDRDPRPRGAGGPRYGTARGRQWTPVNGRGDGEGEGEDGAVAANGPRSRESRERLRSATPRAATPCALTWPPCRALSLRGTRQLTVGLRQCRDGGRRAARSAKDRKTQIPRYLPGRTSSRADSNN